MRAIGHQRALFTVNFCFCVSIHWLTSPSCNNKTVRIKFPFADQLEFATSLGLLKLDQYNLVKETESK